MADTGKPYKVIVNGFEFFFTAAGLSAIDLVKKSPTEFHLIKDHQSINAKLIEAGTGDKKLRFESGGEVFEIEIKDDLDQTLEKMGFGLASNKQIKDIRAPMPGLVLEIAVTEGQDISKGDKIMILEAMKMENSIMIDFTAKVKKIMVKPGQAVEKGQVLVELE